MALLPISIFLLLLDFGICSLGSVIESTSDTLLLKVYELDWYELNAQQRKNVAIVQSLLLAEKVEVKIGGIFTVDRSTLLKLLQTYYTFTTFLWSLKD